MVSPVSSRLSWVRRVFFVAGGFAVGWLSVSAPQDGFDRGVQAQEKARAQAATAEGKPLEFEVISIRRNLAPISPQNPPRFGQTPDESIMRSTFLSSGSFNWLTCRAIWATRDSFAEQVLLERRSG